MNENDVKVPVQAYVSKAVFERIEKQRGIAKRSTFVSHIITEKMMAVN